MNLNGFYKTICILKRFSKNSKECFGILFVLRIQNVENTGKTFLIGDEVKSPSDADDYLIFWKKQESYSCGKIWKHRLGVSVAR